MAGVDQIPISLRHGSRIFPSPSSSSPRHFSTLWPQSLASLLFSCVSHKSKGLPPLFNGCSNQGKRTPGYSPVIQAWHPLHPTLRPSGPGHGSCDLLLSGALRPVAASPAATASSPSSPSRSGGPGPGSAINIPRRNICLIHLFHYEVPPSVRYSPLLRAVAHHHRSEIER